MPIVLFIVAAISCFAAGYDRGDKYGYKRCKIEAVEKSHAVWVVAPDGSTTFVWKEGCK